MEYSELGTSKIKISKICLGTMTFGEQNNINEAHDQLDFAIDKGVNFIDTAEMYPVPPDSKTQGLTESYIGDWIKKRKKRDDIVLATKVTGPSTFMKYIRNDLSINKDNIEKAIHESLNRLNTDYVDLYQIHWPQRDTNYFGKLGYEQSSKINDNIEETLETLNHFIQEGKIRCIGISNETAWGTMRYLEIARKKNLTNIVSIQNPYSLLNRVFEIGLSEVSLQENVKLLAYSPLGFGILTGKYQKNPPSDARLSIWKQFDRYSNTNSLHAVSKYIDLAKENNISPTTLALSFVNDRPFIGSNIIGATNLKQLAQNIDSINTKLSKELLNEINKIHNDIPNPAP